MLFSDIKGASIKTRLGDHIGKLTGVSLNLKDWKIKEVVSSKGLETKDDTAFLLTDIDSYDAEENVIVLKEDAKDNAVKGHSTHECYYSWELLDKKVYSSDEEKVGSVYDFDMPEDVKQWRVWKLLIRTGFKDRRLRITPEKSIKDVKDDLVLTLTEKDVESACQDKPC